MTIKDNNIKIYLIMILATLFWAGAFIAGKLGVSSFTPIQLSFFRFLFSVIILFPILLKKNPDNWKVKKEDFKDFLFLGIIGMIGYHLLFFAALKYTLAYKAAMINAINPLLTTFLAGLLLKEKIKARKIILLIIALIGVVLTIINWKLVNLINLDINKGDLIMSGAMLCWVVYGIYVKKVIHKYGAIKLTTYTMITAIIILLPIVTIDIINNGLVLDQFKPWLGILYMAIFASVYGYTAQQYAIMHIGASNSSMFINLVPVFSMILAVLILKEEILPLNLISAAMIIGAVTLNGYFSSKE